MTSSSASDPPTSAANADIASSSAGPKILSLSDLSITFPNDEVRSHLLSQYSSDHLDLILDASKRSPSDTTCRVNLLKTTRDDLIRDLKEHFNSSADEDGDESIDWDFVPRDVFDDVVVIRHKPTLHKNDQKAQQPSFANCSKPPTTPSKSMSVHPSFVGQDEAITKREAKGWPISHRVVIIDRLCGEAVLRGADIFVKGVLVTDMGIWKGEEVAVYADLMRGDKVLRGSLMEDYAGECVFLGMGIAECDRSTIFRENRGLGIKMCRQQTKRAGLLLPPINGVLPDKMYVQNLPSVLVGHALGPKPGDVILDMCAAPGGKTNHLASLTNNDATIIACDKSRRKMVTAGRNFKALGATCIVPLQLNSTNNVIRDGSKTLSVKEIIEKANASEKDGLLNIKGFYPETFDRILLDPPCSALGLRPRLSMITEGIEDLWKISEYQKKFVDNAVALLKGGGTMTYSTCTFNSSENEAMVSYILAQHPCMELVPIDIDFGLPGLSNKGLTEEQCQCVKRFDPSNESMDTMGFFVAKFVKRNRNS